MGLKRRCTLGLRTTISSALLLRLLLPLPLLCCVAGVMSTTTATPATCSTTNQSKPSVLVVGFGDLGERLCKLVLGKSDVDDDSEDDEFQIVGLRRDLSKLPKGESGIIGLSADYTDKASLLAALESYQNNKNGDSNDDKSPLFDYVIVTQTPSGGFNEVTYQKHYPEATQHLLDTLLLNGRRPPKRIIYVSSISVYDMSDQPITESSPTNPPRFNGKAVLQAERLLLQAAAASSAAASSNSNNQNNILKVTIVRLAGLYGGISDGDGPNWDSDSDGTRTPPRLADHALARAAAKAVAQNQEEPPTKDAAATTTTATPPLLSPMFAPQGGPSKLHRDDAAAALVHILRRCEQQQQQQEKHTTMDARSAATAAAAAASGGGLPLAVVRDCYIVADAAPATNREVAQWLADRAAVEGVELAGLRELYLNNDSSLQQDISAVSRKRCDSSLIRSEGFQLQYPSFREGYAQVYGTAVEAVVKDKK